MVMSLLEFIRLAQILKAMLKKKKKGYIEPLKSGGRGDNRVLLIFRFRGQRKSVKQSVIDLYIVSSQSSKVIY